MVRDGDSPPGINILGTNEVSLAEKMSEPPREVLALIFVMSEPPREIDALIVVIDAPVSPSTPNGDTLTVEFSSSRYVVLPKPTSGLLRDAVLLFSFKIYLYKHYRIMLFKSLFRLV